MTSQLFKETIPITILYDFLEKISMNDFINYKIKNRDILKLGYIVNEAGYITSFKNDKKRIVK
jgi:hypothetical protein